MPENGRKFNWMFLLPARRWLALILAVVVCLSVRVSHVGVLLKRLNVGPRKQRQMIDRDS